MDFHHACVFVCLCELILVYMTSHDELLYNESNDCMSFFSFSVEFLPGVKMNGWRALCWPGIGAWPLARVGTEGGLED